MWRVLFGIICFSSTITDTSISSVISTYEANEATSEEISMSSQLPPKVKRITNKGNPNNNIAFKEHSRIESKEKKI